MDEEPLDLGDEYCIRTMDEEPLDLEETYCGHPNLFSIKLHHGGYFTKFPGRKYVKAKVHWVDYLDTDYFSVHDLDGVINQLGYQGIMYYHFLIPENDLDFGLRPLGNDSDVLNLSKHVFMHKAISVYIEHGETKLPTYLMSPSKVQIEEIAETSNETSQLKTHIRNKASRVLMLEYATNVEQSQGLSIDMDTLLNFEPFLDVPDQNNACNNDKGKLPVTEGDEEEIDEGDNDEDNSGDEESDSEDSDFEFDECTFDNEVEVDMNNFKLYVDDYSDLNISKEEQNEDCDDDVVNNESIESGSDVESECKSKRKRLLKEIRKKQKMGDNNEYRWGFFVGQTFETALEVKEQIRKYSIETRRELKFVKNDKKRIRVVCAGKFVSFSEASGASQKKSTSGPKLSNSVLKSVGGRGKKVNPDQYECPWTLFVSKSKEEPWMVKTLIEEHKCLQSRNIKVCNSDFLATHIVDQIGSNPDIPIKALQQQLQKKFEISISNMQAFRAKSKAKGKLLGDYTTQYGILRDYLHELRVTNPGTTVKVEVEPENNPSIETRVFKRVYVCLGPLKEGFKAIGRDLLGLDGAFMKGPYTGQVLTAVGVDPNNSIYPLCYAIVEAENINSWTWFLRNIGDDLDLQRNSNFTFISDRQKGIIQALEAVFPSAEHRFCLRHIHENLKQKWKGQQYKTLLWKCASATTMQQFQLAMEEIKKLNQDVHVWLSKIPAKHWARSHFSGRSKCDVLLNNMCEVLNRQLVGGRDKPIIVALEFFREYMMKRIVNVLKVIERSEGPLTPTATKTLEVLKKEASQYIVLWNGGDKYQVSGPWGDQCVVDVKNKCCACRKTELTGMPCKHIIATIWNMANNGQDDGIPENWVDPVYRVDTWKQVYSFKVNPINGMSMWTRTNFPTILLPPLHHTPIGRPKKKRRRAAGEEIVSSGRLRKVLKGGKCGKCGGEGHNKRTCSSQPSGSSQPSEPNDV